MAVPDDVLAELQAEADALAARFGGLEAAVAGAMQALAPLADAAFEAGSAVAEAASPALEPAFATGAAGEGRPGRGGRA